MATENKTPLAVKYCLQPATRISHVCVVKQKLNYNQQMEYHLVCTRGKRTLELLKITEPDELDRDEEGNTRDMSTMYYEQMMKMDLEYDIIDCRHFELPPGGNEQERGPLDLEPGKSGTKKTSNSHEFHVLLCTDQYQVIVCRIYQVIDWKCERTVLGDLQPSHSARLTQSRFIGFYDDRRKLYLTHLHQGVVKVVDFSVIAAGAGKQCSSYSFHVPQLQIVDMIFLPASVQPQQQLDQNPKIVMLYQDYANVSMRHVCVYQMQSTDVQTSKWDQLVNLNINYTNLDAGATMLIPVDCSPNFGFIVVGERKIQYFNHAKSSKIDCILSEQVQFTCFSRDWNNVSSSFILADMFGNIHRLTLACDKKSTSPYFSQLKLEKLDHEVGTIPSVLVPLGDEKLFIASNYGDNILYDMLEKNIWKREWNFGPITDMLLQDDGKIAICSGAYSQGALRILEKKYEINSEAITEIANVMNVFSVGRYSNTNKSLLLLSFLESTLVLEVMMSKSGNHFEITEVAETCGVDRMRSTISAFPVNKCKSWVHVSETEIVMLAFDDCRRLKTIRAWDKPLMSTKANQDNIFAVATEVRSLYVYAASETTFSVVHDVQMEDNISSISLCKNYVAVAYWGSELVEVRNIQQQLETVATLNLNAPVRSLLMADLEGVEFADYDFDGQVEEYCEEEDESELIYVVASLESGFIEYARFDLSTRTFALKESLEFSGSLPAKLTFFKQAYTNAFIIASAGDKHIRLSPNWASSTGNYSSLTHHQVKYGVQIVDMCQFGTILENSGVVVVSKNYVSIAQIDIPGYVNLLVKNVPMMSHVRKLGYFESLRMYVVVCSQPCLEMNAHDEYMVRLIDPDAARVIADTFDLDKYEHVQSLSVFKHHIDGVMTEVAVLGIGKTLPLDQESREGRILVLTACKDTSRLKLLTSVRVHGCIFDCKPIVSPVDKKKRYIVVGLNTQVHVFKWDAKGKNLDHVAKYQGFTMALYISPIYSYRDKIMIAAGDIMRSVTMLHFDESKKQLSEFQKDALFCWTTALASNCETGEETNPIKMALVADTNGRIITFDVSEKKPQNSSKVLSRSPYTVDTGFFVNTIKYHPKTDSFVYAGTDGSINALSWPKPKHSPEMLVSLYALCIGVTIPLPERRAAMENCAKTYLIDYEKLEDYASRADKPVFDTFFAGAEIERFNPSAVIPTIEDVLVDLFKVVEKLSRQILG